MRLAKNYVSGLSVKKHDRRPSVHIRRNGVRIP